MEEIVFSIELNFFFTQRAAPLSELFDSLLHLVALIRTETLTRWRARRSVSIRVATLELEKLVLKLIVLFISLFQLGLVRWDLSFKPINLFGCLLFCQWCFFVFSLHIFLLERTLLVHGDFIELHAELHNQLFLYHKLVLRLLQLSVPITKLSLTIAQLHLQLIIDSLNLIVLRLVLLSQSGHVGFELLNELLFISELIFDHLKLFFVLLCAGVVFGWHLQFDVFLLQLLYLLVQVIELRLILLDLVFILVDPLLILSCQLYLVLFEFFYLPLPFIVTLAFQKLNLSFELLNHIIFLLQLHIMETLGGKVTAVIPINSREQVNRVVSPWDTSQSDITIAARNTHLSDLVFGAERVMWAQFTVGSCWSGWLLFTVLECRLCMRRLNILNIYRCHDISSSTLLWKLHHIAGV